MFCGDADCGIEGTGDTATFKGNWYFTTTATGATTSYIQGATAGTYVADTMYARYGHWIELDPGAADNDTDEDLEIYVYAVRGGTGGNTYGSFGHNPARKGLDVNTATYKGGAAGMSVHKTFDASKEQTAIASGAFTADVTLTAKFDDDNPSLSGTIDNFQGGGHVDSAWSVELRTPVTQFGANPGGGVVFSGTGDNGGVTRSPGADDGNWTANSYGRQMTTTGENPETYDIHPDGIFGTFTASFRDGAAVGAYATRKD